MTFKFDDHPNYDEIGIEPLGQVASPRGVDLVSVKRVEPSTTPYDLITLGWQFHAVLSTSLTSTMRIDSGPTRPIPRFVLLPPDAPMEWRSGSCLAAVCLLSPDFMKSLLETEPQLGTTAVNCVMTESSDRLTYLSQQMFRESCSPGFGATISAEALGIEMFVEMVRSDGNHLPDAAPLRGGLAPWQTRRLESYVREHLSQDLSLQNLAEILGMSSRHLSRVIKHDKGISVHHWICELRLSEAQRLLAQTHQPLHEIAESVAFKSPGAFSTAFRAACGVSPSQYRWLTTGGDGSD